MFWLQCCDLVVCHFLEIWKQRQQKRARHVVVYALVAAICYEDAIPAVLVVALRFATCMVASAQDRGPHSLLRWRLVSLIGLGMYYAV